MKRILSRMAALFAAVSVGMSASAAGARLSPALDCLEKKLTLCRCGIVGERVAVTAADIDGALGRKVSLMRVETLPDAAAGRLFVGAMPAVCGQTLTRAALDTVSFMPAAEAVTEAAFAFADLSPEGVGTVLGCRVSLHDEANRAPKAEKMAFGTAKNVSAMLYVPANDPEGDAMTFHVARYPKHGTLTMPEDGGGYFCYTPKKDYTGSDSFSYTATDVFGSVSPAARVEIRIEKPHGGKYFDDLQKHWAANAALKVSALGLMSDKTDADGKSVFAPDEAVSRGDFLAMALICAGKEKEIGLVSTTGFADDADIPMHIKSYAAYAKAHGIVNGVQGDDGRTRFCCASPITRAEAAVIVSRVLALADTDKTVDVFADGASVPDYAAQAMANVYESGIFKGVGKGGMQPMACVTRAQTAQILCEIMKRV